MLLIVSLLSLRGRFLGLLIRYFLNLRVWDCEIIIKLFTCYFLRFFTTGIKMESEHVVLLLFAFEPHSIPNSNENAKKRQVGFC